MAWTSAGIVEYLRTRADRPMKARDLARALGVERADYPVFRQQLRELVAEGSLYRGKHQRYAAPQRINLATGRLQSIRSGAAFLVREDGPDIFIAPEALGSAVDGDRVVARVERRRRGERPQGRVIKVLERARASIVGVYHASRNFGFVTPEDRKLPRDAFVPPGMEAAARDGDVVVLRVTDWGDGHKGPVGEVERVLGRLGEPGVDILSIAYGHELPLRFPPEAEREAEVIEARGIPRDEPARREDLRSLLVFTIDPETAGDHDDALSVRELGPGRLEVGVHIADVGYYVTPGSALDAEALRRGTSVYLVDRVIPMLPEALSGGLCSLLPGVDRLALSVLFELDDEGRVSSHRLTRSIIVCRHRLSYQDAQAVLDGQRAISPALDGALRTLAGVARGLRRRRMERGSIDFDLPEAQVVLDDDGVPIDIRRVARLESHRLIEDFMLLANETIARMAAEAGRPFLYRIHEPPDPDRVAQLSRFLGSLGLPLVAEQPAPRDLQRVLREVEGGPEESLVSTVILRSMKQARYSAESGGHFGLAAEHYTHFTSPIRRYPDLVVHRLCVEAFLGGDTGARSAARGGVSGGEPALADVARLASERERVAVDAERDSVDLKKVEFMERHVGDEFEGTVSGITTFGLFVLLDRYYVEGLVHVSSLDDDYYGFVEERFMLVGEHTGRRFRIGDRVSVRVLRVSLEARSIDFQLLEGGRSGRSGRRTRKSFDTPRRRG